MAETYNIYCDESCHMEHDPYRVMLLGAVWCPIGEVREIADRIREIKSDHGIAPDFESKWTKVSPARLRFYLDLMDYFFDDDHLHFRALVVPDKSKLRHSAFGQTHDEWYYKMYFDMLKTILSPSDRYHIYLDIKDSRSALKVAKLHEVLANNMYDFSRQIVAKVQTVRSHEIPVLQLTDLLIGAVGYANRGLVTDRAKVALVERIRKRSGYSLQRTTLYREDKVNLFFWQPQETNE